MKLSVEASTVELGKALDQYIQASRKSPAEALAKQGNKLTFEISKRLKRSTPAKGSIRVERLQAMESGEGLKIRDSVLEKLAAKKGARSDLKTRAIVYGKRGSKTFRSKGKSLTFRALAVKAELNLRERSRGFTSYIPQVRGVNRLAESPRTIFNRGRYNQILGSASLSDSILGSSLTFSFGSSASEAGAALSTPKAQAAIAASLQTVAAKISSDIAGKISGGGK